MHYHPPASILWDEVVQGPVRLVVPLVVIDELDRKKYSGTMKMASRAGAGGRAIQEIVGSATPGAAVEVRSGVTLEVLVDEQGHTRATAADDEIIERARLLQQIVDAPVSVLTHDLGLQLRAELAGLTSTTLPERYKKPAPVAEE
jgi:predicted ribonuclease YlaK